MSDENDDKTLEPTPPTNNEAGNTKSDQFEDLGGSEQQQTQPDNDASPTSQRERFSFDVPPGTQEDWSESSETTRSEENTSPVPRRRRITIDWQRIRESLQDLMYSIQVLIAQLLTGGKRQKCPYCLSPVKWAGQHRHEIPRCSNPDCGKPLPEDFMWQHTPIIAVVGGKNSGKSTYLTALIKQLLSNNHFLADHQVEVNIENKSGKEKFDAYYETLYVRGERLPGTPVMTKYDAILLRLDRPGRNNSLRSIFLTFYDTPGEEFYDVERLLEYHPNIHNADGILFLADPLNLEGIYEKLHMEGQFNRWTEERLKLLTKSEYSVLQNLRTVLRQKKKLNQKGKVAPPIAVCLSKFDLVENLSPVTTENLEGSSTWTDSLEEVLVDINETSEELYGWLREIDPKFAGGVTNLFSQNHFFPVSPLGAAMEELGNQEINERGVLQPLLWLLREFRFL